MFEIKAKTYLSSIYQSLRHNSFYLFIYSSAEHFLNTQKIYLNRPISI